MAEQPEEYLSSKILNDGSIVTFSLLSRALGISCTEARRFLSDFQSKQNDRKADSVSATYVVSGLQRYPLDTDKHDEKVSANGDGDVLMQDNSAQGHSFTEDAEATSELSIKTISLVDASLLEAAKTRYLQISSLELYSLGPAPLKNLDLIASANEELHLTSYKDDPLVISKVYGSILNPRVKRRTPFHPSIIPSSGAEKVPQLSAKAVFQRSHENTASDSDDSRPATQSDNDANFVKGGKPKSTSVNARHSTLKRDSSDLFKSFAKAKSKTIKKEDEVSTVVPAMTDSSASGTHSMPVGVLSTSQREIASKNLQLVEDDEGDDEMSLIDRSTSDNRKSQREREKDLSRRIFDDEDNEIDQQVIKNKNQSLDEESKVIIDAESRDGEHSDKEDSADKDEQAQLPQATVTDEEMEMEKEEEEEEEEEGGGGGGGEEQQVTVNNGRRRGRRRTVRSRTFKDAEGYFVTQEMPCWESFSEDEPTPKATPRSSGTPSSSAGGKKSSQAKKGQGSITSFFNKK